MDFRSKNRYGTEDLYEIMGILRDPDHGCPWDIIQTHKSIRNDFLEEVYEVCEAIDSEDNENLCEELGDILLQVYFHAKIAESSGSFDINDIADGICKKLIYRHPHVFGDTEVNDAGQVISNWEKLKKEEKGRKTLQDDLKSVPRAMPALMRAQKLYKRTIKAGIKPGNTEETFKNIDKALSEWKKDTHSMKALGELLTEIAGTAYLSGMDSEEALTRASDKIVDGEENNTNE